MPPKSIRPRNGAGKAASPRERSLLRLQQLSSKVLNNTASLETFRLSQAEVEIAETDLDALECDSDELPGVWATFGLDGAAGLVAVYALVLRRSCLALDPGVSDGVRSACGSLRNKLSKGLLRLLADNARDFADGDLLASLACALLRIQAFQCYSVLLSSAATQLAQRRNPRNAQAVSDVLDEAHCLLGMFTVGAVMAAFEEDILHELLDSNLLDHWARGLLLLAGCDGQGRNVGRNLSSMGNVLVLFHPGILTAANFADSPCLAYLQAAHMVQLAADLDGGHAYGLPQAEFAARLLLHAYWLRLALPIDSQLAQWGLSDWAAILRQARSELRAALEQNPGLVEVPGLRGLPGVPRAARSAQPRTGLQAEEGEDVVCASAPTAPAGAAEADNAPPLGGPQGRGALHLTAAAAGSAPLADSQLPPEVRRWLRCAAVPPLNTRAAFEVAMRLAVAASEAMPPASGQQAADRTASDRIQPKSQAAALAVRALRCAREACRDEAAAAGAVASRAVRDRLGRFWSLLVSTVERAQCMVPPTRKSPGNEWSISGFHGILLDVVVPGGAAEELPTAPSPDVAAALSAGYVAGVERLMRRVEPPCGLPLCLHASDHAPITDDSSAAWPQLLAFAPLRDTLSLLATAAKRARRAEEQFDHGRQFHLVYLHDVRSGELLLSTRSLQWLRRMAEAQPAAAASSVLGAAQAAGGGDGGGDEVAADVTAGVPRLCVAVSFIALHILPPLLRVVPELVARVAERSGGYDYSITIPLLGWVPLLAAARLTSSWGADLLSGPEWNLAGLLGAAMGQVLRSSVYGGLEPGMEGLRPALVAALRALVRLAPGLLVEVLPAAEAVARSFTSSRGVYNAYLRVCKGKGVGQGGVKSTAHVSPLFMLARALHRPGGGQAERDLLTEVGRLTQAGAGGSGGGDAAAAEPTPSGAAAAGAESEAAAAGAESEVPADTGSSSASAGFKQELPAELRGWVSAAALLVPPATLSRLLPRCGNPGCANLAGPSERELLLSVVATCGCGAPRGKYCSESCKVAGVNAGVCCVACGAVRWVEVGAG